MPLTVEGHVIKSCLPFFPSQAELTRTESNRVSVTRTPSITSLHRGNCITAYLHQFTSSHTVVDARRREAKKDKEKNTRIGIIGGKR